MNPTNAAAHSMVTNSWPWSPKGTATGTPDAAVAGTPLLQVTDLGVGYRSRSGLNTVVSGVDLTVAAGEVVALVGESGSGKTTTAQAIIGLLPRGGQLLHGEIRVAGTDIAGWSDSRLRTVRGRTIGLVPQDPTVSLDPVKRIGRQVAEALRAHGLAGRRSAAAHVNDILRAAGLDDPEARANQYPHELSGGLRQRVLIGIALACRPKLIIADEPTSALDVTVQARVLDHLDRITTELGTAVLLITHDLGVAADRAHRILVMQHGRVVEQGPAAHILGDPQHAYTRSLIAAAPSLASVRLSGRTSQPVAERPADPGPATSRPADSRPADVSLHRPAVGATQHPPATAPTRNPAAAGATRPPTADAPALRVEHLIKEFRTPVPGDRHRVVRAVDDVSFEIERGRTFALVGESGSGKTTLSRMVLRLVEPTSGRVLVAGQDISAVRGEALRQLRERLQVVYQNPFTSLDPRHTVRQIVAEPLRNFGIGSPADRQARAAELVDAVALPTSALDRHPAELSGGQRQRVAIARALALRPELLVLDEPVSALDVSVQAQILQLLADLQVELGLTYLFISHDLAVVRQISDSIGVLQSGRLVETGSTGEVFSAPSDPYTAQLLAAIPGRRSTTPAAS